MNCRRVEQLLSKDRDGRLSARRAADLAAHLAGCPGCRARRAEFVALGTDLRAATALLRDEHSRSSVRTGSPRLARRAFARFAAGGVRQSPSRAWRLPSLRLIAGGLAGAAVVAALVWWTGSHAPGSDGRVAAGRGVQAVGGGRQEVLGNSEGRGMRNPDRRAEAQPLRTRRLKPRAGKAQSRPSPTERSVREGGLRALLAANSFAGSRLNAAPNTRTSTPRPRDQPARLTRHLPASAHGGDDFVSVPYPRIAAGGPTADRAAAQAVAAYEREVGIVDPRLSHRVSLALKGTAISDVCDRLRSDTGIQVTAGRSVADEKVTVFCHETPLRELMRQLSLPFGYTWLRSGKAGEYKYELVQDLRSQLLEEELRNRDRNAALLALDDEMNQYRKFLDLSPDEALARTKTAPPEERQRLERLATTGWGPARLWFRLSPDDLARLRAGERVTYSAEPWADDDEQALAPELARGGLQALRDARVVLRDGGFRVGDAQSAPEGTPPADLPDARAKFTLELDQSDLGQFTLIGGTGVSISTRGHQHWVDSHDLAIGESPAVRDPQNAVANARLARDPALQPRLSVRPQVSDRSAGSVDLSPDPSPARGGETDGMARERTVTSADVLEAVHWASGINVVADYYTRLYPISAVAVGDRTRFDALNHVADAMHLRWTKEGSWIQFRSTSFFHDRLKEVPNRLLARWAASRRQHGTLTLDDLIEIGQLTDAQLDARSMAEGARVLFGLVEWGLARNHGLRPHLRSLAALTPAQRQEASSPAGLMFRRMALAQQQQFLALCFGSGNRHPQAASLQPGLDELAEASLRIDYMHPGGFHWTAPAAPGDGTPPWLRLPSVREPTREAALQAARRIDPQATEAQVAATELQLTLVYAPGGPGTRFAPGGISATPRRTSNSFAFRQRPR
jgi:hypothetical protein